jgi:hypothetical protein
MKIDFQEHPSSSYIPRTIFNAENSHATLYICSRMMESTNGLELTRMHSKTFGRVNVPLAENFASEAVLEAFRGIPNPVLNVAGNRISRFPEYMTQNMINAQVLTLLTPIVAKHPNLVIRSGGQTGGDWAGIVAGAKLGLEVLVMMPKGFRQRDRKEVDHYHKSVDSLLEDVQNDLIRLGRVIML